jgi:Tfp pilus assembly protein PilX
VDLRTRLRDESGIALVMALGITVVLVIFVASMTTFTTSSVRSARLSTGQLEARDYAEAALNAAYSYVVKQNTTSGGNPSAANLLGCNGATGANDQTPPSNCATPSPKVVCMTSAACTAGTAGTASVFGYYAGSNPGSYAGISVAASTWLLVATGYAPNPGTGGVSAEHAVATVKISPLDNGAVASVWNHMFITSPLVPNQCSVDFGGNGELITDPLYVIGNLCLSGQNVSIQESTGQPVDLQVGGNLVLSGSGTKIGADSSHPITSGVVVGGCTTVSVSSGTMPCASSTYSYWVKTADAFVPNDAPSKTSAQITSDYSSFDPGPQKPCATGGLASTAFDGDGVQDGTNASFELTPNASYTCVSRSGSAVGQLSWDNTAKKLTINGSIFFDGSVTISQSATYTGSAVIEANGSITFNGNGTTVCAESPCDFNNWQGSSGNNSMLTLVALAQNTTSFTFTNNSETFQGSLWCQPSATLTFVKNGVTVEGPLSCGRFDNSFNNASFKPLPVIKNMPVGAPVPPNTSAQVGPLTMTG